MDWVRTCGMDGLDGGLVAVLTVRAVALGMASMDSTDLLTGLEDCLAMVMEKS